MHHFRESVTRSKAYFFFDNYTYVPFDDPSVRSAGDQFVALDGHFGDWLVVAADDLGRLGRVALV